MISGAVPETIRTTYDTNNIIDSIAEESRYKSKQYQIPFFSDGHILYCDKELIDNPDNDVPIISTQDVYRLAKLYMLGRLLQIMGAKEDRGVIESAGSPVRSSSYTKENLDKYPWLAAQYKMLTLSKMLPKDPKLGLFLGDLYESVHKAFTGEMRPRDALESVQSRAMKHYVE